MDTMQGQIGMVQSKLRSERGASMVEFALITPLLFVLLFGIIEFGLILYDQAVITNASREGARYAAMYYIEPSSGQAARRTQGEIRSWVNNYVATRLIGFGSSAPQVTVVDQNSAGVGYARTVTVTYNYNFLVFGDLISLLQGVIPNPLQLTAQTVMRDENQS